MDSASNIRTGCDEHDSVRIRHHHVALIVVLITFRQDLFENQNINDRDHSPNVSLRRSSTCLGKTSPEFECRASHGL